jgi:hypothetical protein
MSEQPETAIFWNRTIKRRIAKWLYGFIGGFIGGGAGAASASLSAMIIKPDAFNLGKDFGNTLKLAGMTFVVMGATHAFAYLAKSPLPGPTGDTEVLPIQKP